jgi:UDP-N-acetylglucosamine 4,6-dehydratase
MRCLITGFGGTLGTEFVKQLLKKNWDVVGVDNAEWCVAAFFDHPNLTKRLMDFSDITGDHDLIIHCGAYKHVDLIENNQDSALVNNITKYLQLLKNCTFKKLLFISTDKAVEPSSYYGWTKQEGERITFEYGGIVARLGNIMASNGSVIPKWEKCIDDGVPLPITDPNMTRYMISVEEAVAKILHLLPHANPGQVIIPEMGEPIKLMDLVDQVIEKHGLKYGFMGEPESYPTEIIGLRPGEKMHEKLKWDNEIEIYKDKNGGIYEDTHYGE